MPSQRRRREANGLAVDLLRSGQPISDTDVLSVLSLWRFRKNNTRLNVLPPGCDFVHSDTLGLVCDRKGQILVDSGTRKWPSVLRLLATWLRHKRPAALEMDFPFTSTCVVKTLQHYMLNSKRGGAIRAYFVIRGIPV